MLTTDNIVRVNVTVNEVSDSAIDYDTGLIVGTTSGTPVALSANHIKLYYSAAQMLTDGFSTNYPEYAAALLYFAQNPAPKAVYIGYRATSDTSITDALERFYGAYGSFWGIYVCGISDADIVSAERWLTQHNKGFLFFGVQHSASNLTKYTGDTSVFKTLKGYNSYRAAGIYGKKENDAAAWLGRIAGLTHVNANTSFSACYKDLAAVQTVDLTATQVDTLEALNANVYVTRGYVYNVLEHATTGSGMRVDECLYLDTIAADLKTATVGLIVNYQGRLPQNDSSSALFVATCSNVMNAYVRRGIIDAGTWTGSTVGTLTKGSMLNSGYYVFIDSYASQTAADRAAHKAMPITICIHLAGSIESVEMTVDVQR